MRVEMTETNIGIYNNYSLDAFSLSVAITRNALMIDGVFNDVTGKHVTEESANVT